MTNDVWLNRVALFVLMTILTTISYATWADESDSAVKSLSSRNIMQKLSNNMQVVTDVISREGWERVAKTALQIVDHPQPPIAEKIRILQVPM